MSNVDLARFLAACMYQLASMVATLVKGDKAAALEYHDSFMKLFSSLDELDGQNADDAP